MKFNAKIKSFGNIKNNSFDIKNLTVFAGENGTGKSFATKSIYCILEALNKDYLTQRLQANTSVVAFYFDSYLKTLSNPAQVDQNFISEVEADFLPALQLLVSESQNATLEEQKKLEETLGHQLSDFRDKVDFYIKERQPVKKMEKPLGFLEDALELILETKELLAQHSNAITQGIQERLTDNFKKNFQITDIQQLMNNNGKEPAKIQFEKIGTIELGNKNSMRFQFTADGIMEIQKLDKVVFIDSPVYLNIRKGLQPTPRFGLASKSRYLKGYPHYIEELYRLIDQRYIDEPELLLISNEIQEMIKGKLQVSRSGEIEYQNDSGSSIPLSLTAMGISNLGLIEILIRNNIIKPGSFLIIDEPEAHLHPKWQVALMDVLYKIAAAGANVIVATHSLDMLKKLELLVNQDETAQDLVAVHRMPGSELDENANLQQKIEEVLTDLSTPFYEMYMQDALE